MVPECAACDYINEISVRHSGVILCKWVCRELSALSYQQSAISFGLHNDAISVLDGGQVKSVLT
jgi:hypothetical protein